MKELRRGEFVEADSGYRGEPSIKTPKDFDNDEGKKKVKNRIRARHENANRRLKTFGVLGKLYRHNVGKHGTYFRAVMVLVQLVNETQSPLFDCEYYV